MTLLPLINIDDATPVGPFIEATFQEKVSGAIEVIKRQVRRGRRLVVACSFGKDSSVTLALTLEAYKQLKAEGVTLPVLHVMHSNTRLENPVIESFAKSEIRKLKSYAEAEGLPVRVWVCSPSLSNNYLVQIIGGRTVASLPDNAAKCQQMMKKEPLERTKRTILKLVREEMGSEFTNDSVVTLIGTRRDESAVRSRKMEERGESEHDAVNLHEDNGGHHWVLSPVAAFTTFDVFEYIGNVTAGRITTYSNFQDLVEIYRDSAGGDCMIVTMLAGQGENKTACGSRHGCHICLRVKADKSMEHMLADEDGRYSWMRPLNDFRNYLGKRHYDPSARNYLARTVDKETGRIKISPNSYSPEFCLELLRYALTIDAEEIEWAQWNGKAPRFQLLGFKEVLAIDFLFARYAYQAPFTALKEYRDIVENGARYYIPTDTPEFDRTGIDFKAEVEAPFADENFNGLFEGLRDVMAATADAESLVEKKTGALYSAVNTDFEFGIDEEGASLFFDIELDRVLAEYGPESGVAPSAAVHVMARYGFLLLKKGGESELERMLRVSNQIHRHGLTPLLNKPQELADRLRTIFAEKAPSIPNIGKLGGGPQACTPGITAQVVTTPVQYALFG